MRLLPHFCLGLISLAAGALVAADVFGQENELAPIVSPPPAQATPSAIPSTSPVATATVAPAPSPVELRDVLFKNLKARAIGPAVMGGRVSDIAIDPHNPFVFYVGLATGGVFKSSNNGVSFEPIFDKQPHLSIGAIAVAPSDPDVIWVTAGANRQDG